LAAACLDENTTMSHLYGAVWRLSYLIKGDVSIPADLDSFVIN